MKIKLKITKQVYSSEDYRIFSCIPLGKYDDLILNKYGNFSIVGNLSMLFAGQECELNIVPDKESKYGMSYRVEQIPSCSVENFTNEMSMGIMCEITTPSQAGYVLDAYPNFVELVVSGRENEIDVNKIYNVGEFRLSVYIRDIRNKFKYLKIMQEFLHYKLTESECKKLVECFIDEKTVFSELKNHPYSCLVQILERDFEETDPLILEHHPDLVESFQRTESLICYVLQLNENDGSTVIDANEMAQYCKDIAPQLVSKLKQTSIDSEYIYYNNETKQIALMNTYVTETNIAEFIKKKLSQDNKWQFDWKYYQKIDGMNLTDCQTNALKNVCESTISLLIGYSGSGKTSATRAILQMAQDNNLSCCVLAPTGKAAMRITEVTGTQAFTIHKRCLSTFPICDDLIIVDETSMVNLSTFCMLLRAISNPYAHIVLVGDPAQLLPIGCGNVFNDMIESEKIPTTMLTEIFRYKDKGSAYVATNIRNGQQFLDGYETQSLSENYTFIQTDDILKTVVKQYISLLNEGYSSDDILCLSPFNVGEEGTYAINNAIQDIVNPEKSKQPFLSLKKGKTTINFREGDKVLCKKNDYDALSYYPEKTIGKIAVVNGQDGKIVKVEEDTLVIDFDGDWVVYPKSRINELLLGWAISVHASQGSEAKAVISITSKKHSKMLNKNLCYVSSTRSKGKHFEVGDISAMNKALRLDMNEERQTMLKEMIINGTNPVN